MDSKDKAIADLRKQVQVLTAAVAPREMQIKKLWERCADYERRETGIDAVRNSLQAERELTLQLNGQLETVKGQVKSLQEENATLKELNLKLQKNEQ